MISPRLHLAVPLALAVLCSCRPDCAIEPALKEFAGDGAKDCGSVTEAGTDALHACYAAALQDGKPFLGYVSGQGIDSKYADGWAANATRKVAHFDYDSCPGGCGDGDPTLFRTVCRKAVLEERVPVCDAVEGTEQICP